MVFGMTARCDLERSCVLPSVPLLFLSSSIMKRILEPVTDSWVVLENPSSTFLDVSRADRFTMASSYTAALQARLAARG